MQNDEQPPFLKSWNQIYVLVLVLHILLICLFYWFTKAYS